MGRSITDDAKKSWPSERNGARPILQLKKIKNFIKNILIIGLHVLRLNWEVFYAQYGVKHCTYLSGGIRVEFLNFQVGVCCAVMN